MAHPYHHALSSARKWGGTPEDYLHIHDWFDESKMISADFRHRALRHHAEGIFMAETIFGSTISISTGRAIPVRWIGEQHVREDLGFVPSFVDWLKAIRPEPWMGRAMKVETDQESPGSSGSTNSSTTPIAGASTTRWHVGRGRIPPLGHPPVA